jgi:hypothetical protein
MTGCYLRQDGREGQAVPSRLWAWPLSRLAPGATCPMPRGRPPATPGCRRPGVAPEPSASPPWSAREPGHAPAPPPCLSPAARSSREAWPCRWDPRNFAPLALSRSMTCSRCASKRAGLSRRTTTSVSPGRIAAKCRAKARRMRSAPEACSSWMAPQPVWRSSTSCG